MRSAMAASRVSRTLVATDNQRVFDAVVRHGGEAMMTGEAHRSGTDRIAEAARKIDCELIVNVQGDEPLIEPEVIDAAIAPFDEDPGLDMSTTKEPIGAAGDLLNPNVVKVVTGENGFALYFTRSPVPYPRTRMESQCEFSAEQIREAIAAEPSLLESYAKHTGLYVYRRDVLLRLTELPPSRLEVMESLEQLRALEHGYRIKVVPVQSRSIAVDTAEDLERVRAIFAEERAAREQAAV